MHLWLIAGAGLKAGLENVAYVLRKSNFPKMMEVFRKGRGNGRIKNGSHVSAKVTGT